jgi:hypothetical protein
MTIKLLQMLDWPMLAEGAAVVLFAVSPFVAVPHLVSLMG